MKFTRRKDLDTQTRLTIILSALSCMGTYGAMTNLALQYDISRTFLYNLVGMAMLCLNDLVTVDPPETSSPPQFDIDKVILLLRLEGKCSISSISNILKMMSYSKNSQGMTSELLTRYGRHLSATLSSDENHHIVYLADEIFASGLPVLITIDAMSTTILKIELASDRTAKTWEKHFQSIKENNYLSKGLGSDRGIGIIQGYQAVCPDSPWYTDHFHEFRGLYKLLHTFEKQAYAAIEEEEECLRKFNNARSEENLCKRLEHYEQAVDYCMEKIEFYQLLEDLLRRVKPLMRFFDNSGKPHTRKQVKEELLIIMDGVEKLENEQISREAQSIRSHIDEIVLCYRQVEESYKELSAILPKEALDFVCLAWQHDHLSHQTRSKVKHHHQNERDFWQECAIPLLDQQDETLIKQAFELLNKMVRTSSLIEMVNSLVRPYLNACKGQITQETLNLIMFYHNYRPYKSGKRKGKALIELLTGKKLEKDWLESLVETLFQTTA